MDRYTIKDIRSDLEQKRGEPYNDEIFNNLLSSFAAYAQSRRWYEKSALYKAYKRGWMTAPMARLFKQYAAQ